ncbi:AAA ATPase, AAA+ lid domain [Dillenia turbinata]|uniref:AAA ATPase, AAA+ lid domain n=1 Tax=Dillenia turbinata TaxID=194707 RepID=A0AAN8ZRT2_9MAGN
MTEGNSGRNDISSQTGFLPSFIAFSWSFCAQLLANARTAAADNNKTKLQVNANGVVIDGAQAQPRKLAAVPKNVQKRVPLKPKTKPENVIGTSSDKEVEEIKKENTPAKASKKKVHSLTFVLTARSKAACGLANKPKKQIVDIDAADTNNELAVVEYVEDNENRVHPYMDSQPDVNDKMRAILIDWLIEVHNKFELLPETLNLTVNDFVCISDMAYSHRYILLMEKSILAKLDWYLTVPTPYVFLSRFIKASIPDQDCPSMIAASAVYAARRTLGKSPAWNDTLKLHTGFSEQQLIQRQEEEMPSKGKKQQSKSSSRLSQQESTPSQVAEIDEGQLLSSKAEAASRFPSLIATSAFTGRISAVDSATHGAIVWLSESDMSAFSLHNGSLVSVCLASRNALSSTFPLNSLVEEYASNSGVDFREQMAVDDAGNYFALATVFYSSKVLKNEAQLSSDLSITLGCPPLSRVLFVCSVQTLFLSNLKYEKDKLCGISLYPCKEICLELVSSKIASRRKCSFPSLINSPVETVHDRFENEKLASPRTPVSCHSSLSLPISGLSSSAIHEESASSSTNMDKMHIDVLDVGQMLSNEITRKLVEIPAASWLYSRSLFPGNLVAIPILSEQCIFRVIDADKLMDCGVNQELTNGGCDSLSRPPTSMKDYENAFVIGHETKVVISSKLNSVLQSPRGRGLQSVKVEYKGLKARMECGVLKLGGLSKEYAILMDIIFSSVKNTLSSLGLRTTKGVLLHGPPGTGKTSLAKLCARDAGVNLFVVNGPEIVSQYYGESEQKLHEVFDSASQAAPAVRSGPSQAVVNLVLAIESDGCLEGDEYGVVDVAVDEDKGHEQSRRRKVFIDELDAIAPARKDGGEELSQRMVATLLNLMDGISKPEGFLVIAATNRPDSIESALRRPGRLDREIEIGSKLYNFCLKFSQDGGIGKAKILVRKNMKWKLGVPSPKQRLDILSTLLNEMEHSLTDIQVEHLAMTTHGFVGADLASLCNEAAFVCLRHYIKFNKYYNHVHSGKASRNNGFSDGTMGTNFSEDEDNYILEDQPNIASPRCSVLPISSVIPQSPGLRGFGQGSITSTKNDADINVVEESYLIEKPLLKVTFEDFEKARLKVRPSAMREVVLEIPKVKWLDVGGQKEVKAQLMEAVEWPQKHQDAFKRIGTCPPTGVLMFGPPGCSKTLLARAVASEAGLNFLAVKGPELFSKWVGESEKAVKSLFRKARANAPSVIFFDEIDGLAVIRGKESDGVSVADRVLSQLLVELDGLHERVNVTVIAATNRPDKIDPALLRPGRFDRLIYVGPPNKTDREDIFKIHLHKMPCSSDVSIKELASLTEGYTGADISLICREAAVAAIEESLDAVQVTMEHLRTAIGKLRPSQVQSFEELSEKFQRLVHSSARSKELEDQTCSSISNSIPSW